MQGKDPARLISEIKDEARLWASAGAKDLSTIVDQQISE
jgi:hypothetical protein